MNQYRAIGSGIYVHPSVQMGEGVTIGHCSIIGYGDEAGEATIIEDGVIIGAFCTVQLGAVLRSGVSLDDYSKVCRGAEVGTKTRLLYAKHISEEAQVGANCIIGGHVADRTTIEDNVTFMGEIAHSHHNATLDWDETEEESPVIKRGSVVGVNALIIGPRKIGPCAYIAAGEVVRTDVGEGMLLSKGIIEPLSKHRGLFKTRC